MKITIKEWLASVKREADNIKKFSTPSETKKLNFNTLNPNTPSDCVYGQMTGSCVSGRAQNLIVKCCDKFTVINDDTELEDKTFSETRNIINGNVNTRKELGRDIFMHTKYFSAIEHYILTKGAKNKHLIAYIKGEVDELVL